MAVPSSLTRAAPLPQASAPAESGLDPADWQAYRRLLHDAVDIAVDHLAGIADGPVWQAMSPEDRAALRRPLPSVGTDPAALVEEIRTGVMPYAVGNPHPRFFGWVHGGGLAGGLIADLLASAMNANLGGRDHAPVEIERTVVDWFRDLFGLPEGAGGLLVSGTSMATVVALAAARTRLGGVRVRQEGLAALAGPVAIYASSEVHGSLKKAAELLGLGAAAVRGVPVDAAFRIDLEALHALMDADAAAGVRPLAVVGSAGTVNTGAVDDLDGLADAAQSAGCWFHVDGAIGAVGMMDPAFAPRLKGLERADSIAFDAHKWLQMQYDCGCVLVRDAGLLTDTFGERQAYLAGAARGLAAGDPWFCESGPELSRGFRALRVWFALREHGTEAFGRMMARTRRLAAHLAERVDDRPDLVRLAPVDLTIVCLRWVHPGLDDAALDRVNQAIVEDLHETGIAAPSTTRLAGRLAIRVSISNHRTRQADIDALVEAIGALGRLRGDQERIRAAAADAG